MAGENVLLRKLINGKKVPDNVVKGREAEKRKNTPFKLKWGGSKPEENINKK